MLGWRVSQEEVYEVDEFTLRVLLTSAFKEQACMYRAGASSEAQAESAARRLQPSKCPWQLERFPELAGGLSTLNWAYSKLRSKTQKYV